MNATPDIANVWSLQSRYDVLVELAPDGIFVHDGNRIVLVNAAALHLAGASRAEEVIGLPIDTFLRPPHLKALQAEIIGSQVPTRSAEPVRETFSRLDGSTLPVETRAVLFSDQGRLAIHLVVRDMTQRVAAEVISRTVEERMHQAQRMEASGALAGGVAHEVNNMMTVVLGYSDFLLTDGHLPLEAIPDVQQIAKAATRAAAITQQLLAFSRRIHHTPAVIDLGEWVRTSISMLQRLLTGSRTLTVAHEISAPVRIDPAQLEQVLTNLVLNARDATQPYGNVTISTNVVHLTFGSTSAEGVVIPAGEYVTLSVSDNGSGMSDDTMKRIFEPFFSTKPVGEGTGLGLAAVHGMLRQSGGYITVESTVGEGSNFVVLLPVHGHQSTNQRDRAAFDYTTTVSLPLASVLIVDGEAAVRMVAVRALEESGLSVVTAADEHEALALIAQNGPPDLVIADIEVPAVGGSDLARQLAMRFPLLPIVFLSGYSPDHLFQPHMGGRHPFTIQKPFSPGQLVSVVLASLSHRAVMPRASPAVV
ncbi:MAG: response regulator [Phycisphaerae bacterium]|nr:response regulator [Gemmatimonadaceae bacterium]